MRMKILFALPMAAAVLAAPLTIAPASAKNSGNSTSEREATYQSLGVALMAAVVSDSGKLIRGAGVSKISVVDDVEFTITFQRDISQCSYTAGLTAFDSAVNIEANPKGDELKVISAGGFNIFVYCWK